MRTTCAAAGQSRCGTTSALVVHVLISMRPWALSTVSAERRSCGRSACPSQGGKIAEALGDGVVKLRLVVLDREQVVSSGVAYVPADLALTEDGVACDDRAVERQALEQRERSGDLVLIGLDDEIADYRREAGGEGGEHMQRLGIVAAAALERLAIDGDVAGRGIAEGEPAKHASERVGIERKEDVMVRA
jgi:hypothetical protein